ncbi:hypothetical protein [Nocardioides sp.]|uniref:hypothetical protein n=1 Tax=Nocardioides sp. TaxID=35761 RepID=UPI003563B4BB
MSSSALVGLAAGLAAALLFGGGAVLQAHAVRRLEVDPGHLVRFVLASIRNPWIMLVVLSYLVGFVLHAVAIWLLPLYLAQATIAMSLPVTAVTSVLIQERLSAVHWWAVAVITGGLVLLAVGAGSAGAVVVTGPFVAALWLGVLALVVAARLGSGGGGAALGGLSGVAYAGSAIAVRGVENQLSWLVLGAAVVVGVYGLLGFWLYSLGLERTSVSSATGPLIVGETYVPALIGLLLLGDGVRSGWGWAVLLGFVLATGGAIVLGRQIRTPGAPATPSAAGPAPRPA